MNLAQTVHTAGINWESIGAIAALLAVAVTTILWALTRREQKADTREHMAEQRNNEIKQEIAASVNHLSEVLLAKLETKETVARISERLARLESARRDDFLREPNNG